MKRYWRRCKQRKRPYDEDEAAKRISFLREPEDVEREIAKRVAEDGDKATIDGIHDYMHELYRNKLLEEMIRIGWNKRRAMYWIWKDWSIFKEEDNSGTN